MLLCVSEASRTASRISATSGWNSRSTFTWWPSSSTGARPATPGSAVRPLRPDRSSKDANAQAATSRPEGASMRRPEGIPVRQGGEDVKGGIP